MTRNPAVLRHAGIAICLAAFLFDSCKSAEVEGDPQPDAPAEEARKEVRPPLYVIAALEAARSDGAGELQELLRGGDERVRARAAQALGRLPFPEHGEATTSALAAALADPSAEVRAVAAFGIGLRRDPASLAAVRAAWDDPEPVVRARLVEAASRLPDAGLHQEILHRLFSDPSFRVRIEAAVAAHRWPVDGPATDEVDDALARAALAGIERGAEAGEGLTRSPEAPEVVWRALFSLERRAAARAQAGKREETPARARAALLHWARPEARGDARLFAVKGLGALPPSERVREALYAALESSDWRIACEAALGLGEMSHPEAVAPLRRAQGHRSAHVRRAVARALGGFSSERAAVGPLLERAFADGSPNVRAAAIESLARLDGAGAGAELGARALDADPRIRTGAAKATAHVPSEVAVPILLRLSRDADRLVATSATRALGRHLRPEVRAHLHGLLGDPDNGLRLSAISALGEAPLPEDLAPLEHVWASSHGDISPQIRVAALEAAAKIGGEDAVALLQSGLGAGRHHERAVARRGLEELLPAGELPPASPPPMSASPEVPAPQGSRQTVEVQTTRGTLVFELFADEAPFHVHNFLQLARAGHYDGLRFHRVELDFVVQGGDYRGDGSGGVTWNGEPLPAEFGPRKYLRGALGMPRSDDPDSGGSQIFVTHRPTPHLDGRYTLFGELRQGDDALDAIEVGDRILSVKVRGSRN